MEHGEPCVMISGVQWMQVWPADNWASLETVSVYCCHCCCSIHTVLFVVQQSENVSFQVKSLSYFTDAIAYSRAFYGQGTGSIWLDNVQCTGTESRLFDCPANTVGSHNCAHFEDAGASCQVLGK